MKNRRSGVIDTYMSTDPDSLFFYKVCPQKMPHIEKSSEKR